MSTSLRADPTCRVRRGAPRWRDRQHRVFHDPASTRGPTTRSAPARAMPRRASRRCSSTTRGRRLPGGRHRRRPLRSRRRRYDERIPGHDADRERTLLRAVVPRWRGRSGRARRSTSTPRTVTVSSRRRSRSCSRFRCSAATGTSRRRTREATRSACVSTAGSVARGHALPGRHQRRDRVRPDFDHGRSVRNERQRGRTRRRGVEVSASRPHRA